MRLRTVLLIYVLSTAAAIAAPSVMTAVENARWKTIPVNSEPSLESAPILQSRAMWSGDGPACSAPNGTIYYGNSKQSDAGDPGENMRPFADSLGSGFLTCAVSSDGTVYALGSTNDRTWWLNAYEPTGKVKWSVPTQEVCSRLALGDHGLVYLLSRPRNGTTVLTAYRADGSKLWETPIGGTGWHPTAPVVAADGAIYVIAESFTAPSQLVAIASAGKEIWRATVLHSASENTHGLIVGEDGRIFMQVVHGAVAFDEHGEKLWEFTSGNQDLDGGIALGGDGTLYVASRFLYALDRTGKAKWDFKSELTYTNRDYFGHHPVIAKDGTIYANSYYDQLYAITPDGRKKWLMSGEPRVVTRAWGQPTLTQDGKLVTNAGWFDVASGLASSGWPAENRDNSNSRRQENP